MGTRPLKKPHPLPQLPSRPLSCNLEAMSLCTLYSPDLPAMLLLAWLPSLLVCPCSQLLVEPPPSLWCVFLWSLYSKQWFCDTWRKPMFTYVSVCWYTSCLLVCSKTSTLCQPHTQNGRVDLTSSALATMAILSGREPHSFTRESVRSDEGGEEAGTSPHIVLVHPQLQKQSYSSDPTPQESDEGVKVAETSPQSMLAQPQPQKRSRTTSAPTPRKSVNSVNSDEGDKMAEMSRKILLVQPQLRSLLTNSM